MFERVYRNKQWQNNLNPLPGSTRVLRQQRYGVETVGRLLVRKEEDYTFVPQGRVEALYVCGNKTGKVACSRMITLLDDGSQLRSRRSEAIPTLEKRALESSVELMVVDCDVHGGMPFPPTQAIGEELVRQHILRPY